VALPSNPDTAGVRRASADAPSGPFDPAAELAKWRARASVAKFFALGLLLALFVFLSLVPPTASAANSAGATVAGAGAAIFVAAVVSSIAGFAFAALAGAPLLFLLGNPVQAVATVVVCSIAIQGYCVFALRRSIQWRALWPFLAAGVPAVPAGVWLLTHIDPSIFAFGLSVFLTLYGLYMFFRGTPPVVRGTWQSDVVAGALGGVTGGLCGFPGAFVTIWCGMRGWSKEHQRAVYQPYILTMQLVALGALGFQAPDAINQDGILVFVPLALLGASLGLALFRRLSTRQFTMAVNALLVASAIALFGGAL
jgi:uncharacterized membrane protein YfcA